MHHTQTDRGSRVSVPITREQRQTLVREAATRSIAAGRPVSVSAVAREALQVGLTVAAHTPNNEAA